MNVFEDGAVVTPEVLLEKGIVSKLYDRLKYWVMETAEELDS